VPQLVLVLVLVMTALLLLLLLVLVLLRVLVLVLVLAVLVPTAGAGQTWVASAPRATNDTNAVIALCRHTRAPADAVSRCHACNKS
jgi:hypothetical protein